MNYFVLSSFVFVKPHPRRTKSLPYIVTSLSPYVPFPKSFSCNIYAAPRKYCKQTTYSLGKSFRCNTYTKPGEGIFFPILENLGRSCRRELGFHSSSFFSHSCALFCTGEKLNSFIFKRFRTLQPKTPGVGGPSCSRSVHCRSQKGTLNMSESARCKASLLPYLLPSLLPSFPLVDRWAKAGDNFKSPQLAGAAHDLDDADVLLKDAKSLEDGTCLTQTT